MGGRTLTLSAKALQVVSYALSVGPLLNNEGFPDLMLHSVEQLSDEESCPQSCSAKYILTHSGCERKSLLNQPGNSRMLWNLEIMFAWPRPVHIDDPQESSSQCAE